MDDETRDPEAERRRSLLHGAPQPAPRQPNPGELLMTFEHGQDAYRVELRRPALGSPSRYLLTNLSLCSCCGGTLYVVTRSNGSTRKRFYGCSNRHERGTCVNKADVPMPDADLVVIEAVLDDILDESIVRDSVDEALALLRGDAPDDRLDQLERELGAVTREHQNLMKAIQSGDRIAGLLEALRALDRRRQALEAD